MTTARIIGGERPEQEPVSPEEFAAAIVRVLGPSRRPHVPVFMDEPDVDLDVSDGDAAWMQQAYDRGLTDLWFGGRVA